MAAENADRARQRALDAKRQLHDMGVERKGPMLTIAPDRASEAAGLTLTERAAGLAQRRVLGKLAALRGQGESYTTGYDNQGNRWTTSRWRDIDTTTVEPPER